MLAGTIIAYLLGIGLLAAFALLIGLIIWGLTAATREPRFDRKLERAKQEFKPKIANAQNIPVISHTEGPMNISLAQLLYNEEMTKTYATPEYLSDLHKWLAGYEVPRFDNDPAIRDRIES